MDEAEEDGLHIHHVNESCDLNTCVRIACGMHLLEVIQRSSVVLQYAEPFEVVIYYNHFLLAN